MFTPREKKPVGETDEMKLKREATGHEDRVRAQKARLATVLVSLEPLVDLVAQLIADERLKEIESQIDRGNSEIKSHLYDRETNLRGLPDSVG